MYLLNVLLPLRKILEGLWAKVTLVSEIRSTIMANVEIWKVTVVHDKAPLKSICSQGHLFNSALHFNEELSMLIVKPYRLIFM